MREVWVAATMLAALLIGCTAVVVSDVRAGGWTVYGDVEAAYCASVIEADLDTAAETIGEFVQVPDTDWRDLYHGCVQGVYSSPGTVGSVAVWDDGSYVISGYGDWFSGSPYGTLSWDGRADWDWGSF